MWRRLLVLLGLASVGCDKPPETTPPAKTTTSAAHAKLVARIGDVNNPTHPRPLVTLAEFFEGNDDYGSIGYNLPDSPSPQEWYTLLKEMAARSEVRDVRIAVNQLEVPEEWPSTDTIWVITTASPEEVQSWLPEKLRPDDVILGFKDWPGPYEKYDVPVGYRAIGLWYD
jgi:hypothetical protein